MADRVDLLAGGTPHSAPFGIRRQRPAFMDGVAECRAAVLVPRNDLGIDADLAHTLGHSEPFKEQNLKGVSS